MPSLHLLHRDALNFTAGARRSFPSTDRNLHTFLRLKLSSHEPIARVAGGTELKGDVPAVVPVLPAENSDLSQLIIRQIEREAARLGN